MLIVSSDQVNKQGGGIYIISLFAFGEYLVITQRSAKFTAKVRKKITKEFQLITNQISLNLVFGLFLCGSLRFFFVDLCVITKKFAEGELALNLKHKK